MMHPKYGHITYRVEIYTDGERKPYEREFEHWQTAYAYIRDHIRTNAAATNCIDVIKHRYDGFIYTGIFRWRPGPGRIV